MGENSITCECVSGCENKKSEVLALTLTLFVDPPGLPDMPSLRSVCRDRLLAQFIPPQATQQRKPLLAAFFVDPPGLEPGLCGTKIRRVANYTMGQ